MVDILCPSPVCRLLPALWKTNHIRADPVLSLQHLDKNNGSWHSGVSKPNKIKSLILFSLTCCRITSGTYYFPYLVVLISTQQTSETLLCLRQWFQAKLSHYMKVESHKKMCVGSLECENSILLRLLNCVFILNFSLDWNSPFQATLTCRV